MDPCSRCGRTLRDVAMAATVQQRRGAEPLCPVAACPLLAQIRSLVPIIQGREAQGPSPPVVFVGRVGWPRVRVGPVLPPTPVPDAALLDDPHRWRTMPLEEILMLRAGLLRGVRSVHVETARQPDRVLSVTQELALGERPVETEVKFDREVRVPAQLVSLGHSAPAGPSVTITGARLVDSVSVPRIVDRLVTDEHAPASVAMGEMYTGGIGVEHLARLLSSGNLGRANARLFVPTRWSVTAADDTVGRQLVDRIVGLQPLGDDAAHASELHGNRFLVVLRAGPWSFEMVEAWQGEHGWKVLRDAEERTAKRDYADAITGAYYAARLGVLEHLTRLQRQASVTVLRIITPDYFAPAGVWVIREGVRMALEGQPTARGLEVAPLTRSWAGDAPILDRATTLQKRQASLDRFDQQRP